MVSSDDSFPYVDFAYFQGFFDNYVFTSGRVSDGKTSNILTSYIQQARSVESKWPLPRDNRKRDKRWEQKFREDEMNK